MENLHLDNVKAEKAHALLRYRRVRTVTNLFRFVEISLAILLFSYVSTRLPFAVKLAGEYFRLLFTIVVKPVFAFLISNVIILALLFKSGKKSGNVESQIYDEFIVENSEAKTEFSRSENRSESEIVYQDKQIISEVKLISKSPQPQCEIKKDVEEEEEFVMKIFRRSKSEKLRTERPNGILRRSETEMCRKIGEDLTVDEELDGVDELSNEEFQRTIEAFIERQVSFRRQEMFAVVPHVKPDFK